MSDHGREYRSREFSMFCVSKRTAYRFLCGFLDWEKINSIGHVYCKYIWYNYLNKLILQLGGMLLPPIHAIHSIPVDAFPSCLPRRMLCLPHSPQSLPWQQHIPTNFSSNDGIARNNWYPRLVSHHPGNGLWTDVHVHVNEWLHADFRSTEVCHNDLEKSCFTLAILSIYFHEIYNSSSDT